MTELLTGLWAANFTHRFRSTFDEYIAVFLAKLANNDASTSKLRDKLKGFEYAEFQAALIRHISWLQTV